MLERILKPATNNAKDTNNVRRSVKRPRETSPKKEVKSENERSKYNGDLDGIENRLAEKVEIKSEPATPVIENSKIDLSEYQDMDFSILEDDENQFGTDVASSAAQAEKSEKMKAELLKKESENFADLLSDWENICANEEDADDELLSSIDIDVQKNALAGSVDEKKLLRFWFWDAYEDPMRFPGKVFLFGKMPMENNPKEFKSVCVTVENVEKCFYLLPRKYVCIYHLSFEKKYFLIKIWIFYCLGFRSRYQTTDKQRGHHR